MDISSMANNFSGQDIIITSKSTKCTKDKLKGDTVMKYQHNKKSYNSRWETDPLLKTWIARHPVDNGKVVCQFCQSVIRAHKNDLLEHTRTLKHQRNFMANSSPETYNQFVMELNELRKDTQVISKKRSGKSLNNNNNNNSTNNNNSSSNSNNNNIASLTLTSSSNNCINISNNSSNSLPNNIMCINSWTSIDTNGVMNNNNCKGSNEEEEDDDDDNRMSNNNDISNGVDLWPENNNHSPSDLVSVILEEQLDEQVGSPNANSNSSICSVSLSSSLPPPTLTPIINISSMPSPLQHHLQQQQQQTGQQQHASTTRLLKPESAPAVSYTVTSLNFTSSDVISAIKDNYFSLSDLVEIAKYAVSAIGNSINPPSLVINPPIHQNQQQIDLKISSKRDSKRKAKKRGDKVRKKVKSIKTERELSFPGLESL